MCGILWFDLTGLSDDEIALLKDQFAKSIAHRGPDASVVTVNNNQLWVFHRLSIINPTPTGMQPFVSNIGSTSICNGEIYNYESLAQRHGKTNLKSDCEVITIVLDKCSTMSEIVRAIDSLDGDFAFVWGNKNNTVIGRDPVGVYPLFYGINHIGELVGVASESKALIGAPNVVKVQVFPPGFVWVNGKFYRYHKNELQAPIMTTNGSAIAKVRELVTRAVQKRLCHSERPVGVLCSGGVDSSIVTCLLCELGFKDKVHVFTMEYEGARSEDAFYARMLCEKIGVKQTVFSFTRDDVQKTLPKVIKACETHDSNTIRAAIPMYILAEKISQNTDVKVILSGEGADELFYGYNYFRKAPDAESARKEAWRLVQNIHMFDLLRAERCFAHVGLEVRVPFLDKDLIDYMQSIDGGMVWGGKGYAEKQLLRDAFAHIKSLSDVRILDRPKERFSDGCGFSYVPQYLSDISNGLSRLDERLVVEKKTVEEEFEKRYPCHKHLIIERTMPSWAQTEVCDNVLAM